MKTFLVFLICIGLMIIPCQVSGLTIDFDDLTAGNVVTDIGAVSFDSNTGLNLMVSTGGPTTSGPNYLGVADGGDELFLGYWGDKIYLDFSTGVSRLSVSFVGVPVEDAEYQILTDEGSASKTVADYSLTDDDLVFNVIFESLTPFMSATLTALGDLAAYSIDDISITFADETPLPDPVPEPSTAILMFLGLLGIVRLNMRGIF